MSNITGCPKKNGAMLKRLFETSHHFFGTPCQSLNSSPYLRKKSLYGLRAEFLAVFSPYFYEKSLFSKMQLKQRIIYYCFHGSDSLQGVINE